VRAAAARGEQVPALWRGLAAGGAPARPAAGAAAGAAGPNLAQQLAELSAEDRHRALVDLVGAHTAAVLGHASAAAVESDRTFKDLGFDSLAAVEFRNRLGAATGLRLPSTLIFDYPVPSVLVGYLAGQLEPSAAAADDGVEAKLRGVLASIPITRLRDAGLVDALLRLADDAGAAGAATAAPAERAELIDSLDAEDLVRIALEAEGSDF
jgi:acyl carrier protein